MSRRPRVPGLNEEWAREQLMIPSAPCPSCTITMTSAAQVGQPWDCDPDRPGCPLHLVPEQTRERVPCWNPGGPCPVPDAPDCDTCGVKR